MKTAVPAFVQSAVLSSARLTAANTSSQGGGTIGTDIFLIATSGADDMFLERVLLSPTATAPTATTATVARVYESTQSSGATTSANTFLIAEVILPATNADNATVSAPVIAVPLNMSIPAGRSILVTTHAAPAANTAWVAKAVAGNF